MTWTPLADSFGRKHDYLRISLTDRCNFRCQYCMPEGEIDWKPKSELLTFEEICRLATVFARLGVRKVRLTGGEPTLRKGLVALIRELWQILPDGELLMTTNGMTLARQSSDLRAAGLSGVNVSMDSLRRERFLEITRRDSIEEVLAGVNAALKSGLKTKVNVVVLPGLNEDELCDFVEYFSDRSVEVRFIEFMPFLGNLWEPKKVFGYREMLAALEKRFTLVPRATGRGAVAKEFSVLGSQATVGFITSMTESFCSDCNRIRLTSDGKLKTCLFLPPQTSLRDLMRGGATDDELAISIRCDLSEKWAGHPPMHKWKQLDSLSMVQIGG